MTRGAGPGFGGERGQTLVELVIALATLSIAMTIFTTTILAIHGVTNRTESLATATTQISLAALRLDAEVRYASGISEPGMVLAHPSVEYLRLDTGAPTCVGLRLNTDSQLLQRRSWERGDLPGASDWRTLARGVTASSPFTRLLPDDVYPVQRLRVALTATAGTGGSGASASSRELDLTMVALNTTARTASTDVCSEGRTAP